ncbi:hypothetical protein BHS06_20630 [Myxococcus xanthus]|uniref:hypothetical protein n=1 Tax=Myxococcus xanthus TaxID=34 RepID=UPI00112C5AB7|nr:hypothetical protein [Myxococcus xanthus]QDE91187.1 hypothetical protein BHS06_20630 [Myxococcus xanthus]
MSTVPTQPAQKSGKNTILIIAAVAMVVGGIGAATLLLGRQPSDVGSLGETDVGGLQELAAIQAQLRPLRACGIEYGERGRRMKSGSHTSVWVSACENDRFAGVRIEVPTARQVEGVTFDLERSSVSEPWKILVDKNQVPFPELKRTLEQLTPFLVEEIPSRLAQAIEAKVAADRERQKRQAAEPARREASKNSYPE